MRITGVVVFAFGTPATISSNERLARIASDRARRLVAPVYTQRDILVGAEQRVQYIEEEGSPPPTLRIARGAVQWAIERGINHLLIIAARPHLRRVLRDVRKAVREARVEIEVYSCSEIENSKESSWFCPDSKQPRVRSAINWYPREVILRWMPFFLYKLLAS